MHIDNKLSVIKGEQLEEIINNYTLAELFTNTAKKYSTKTAIEFNNKHYSYKEIDDWSNNIAQLLNNNNIGRNCSVGVYLQRSVELHVAILGIIKSGAAYVGLDIDFPLDRVNTIIDEGKLSACFTEIVQELNCTKLLVPTQSEISEIIQQRQFPTLSDNAYVIYTSGSTGKPKGIPIEHSMISHLVQSENHLLKITSDDRVYQGFSVSFDMWCEETLISYFAGATIIVADAITSKSIDDLGKFLTKNKITVWHAVPSLMALIDDEIPTLRIVNSGGEACTPLVLQKWAKPSITFYNSYGPTETTVSTTFAQLQQNDKIYLGSPLPNYDLAVVDDQLNVVEKGKKGELIISGPGVSRGYINREELTKEKFLPIPEKLNFLNGERLYKSGDEVLINENNELIFFGRIDDQVKLRGYRIELGEIESILAKITAVVNAAVTIKTDKNNIDHLVAYLVLQEGKSLDVESIKKELSAHLTTYMMPDYFVELTEMPRLSSGKINRKELPTPDEFEHITSIENAVFNFDGTQSNKEIILQTLHALFPGNEITEDKDFFYDLGGHSMLAATFVSQLRKHGITQASLKDIYQQRKIGNLIQLWEKTIVSKSANTEKRAAFNHVNYYLCWFLQTIMLPIIFLLFTIQFYTAFITYYVMQVEFENHLYSGITAVLSFIILSPFFAIFSIAAKKIIIGKFKEGDYPLWGTYYFRYWLIKSIKKLSQAYLINSTPLYNSYLRRSGAIIGADAQLVDFEVGAEDLLTIGENVSISAGVVLNNIWVENGLLKIRKITIGDNVNIAGNTMINGGCVIGNNVDLLEETMVEENTIIPANEIWSGSPAKRIEIKSPNELLEPLGFIANRKNIITTNIKYILLLSLFSIVMSLPLMPIIIIFYYLDDSSGYYDFSYFKYTPALSLLYIILQIFVTVIVNHICSYFIKEGKFAIHTKPYFFKWFSDLVNAQSLVILHPLYATIYIRSFYRLLGAKIGKNTEISTASNVTHSLLNIGENAFIADGVNLGEADVRNSWLILKKTSIGNNSFVGNSAIIPQGYNLPDNTLIGVLSAPPTIEQIAANPNMDWFGSPAIGLPTRQKFNSFDISTTYQPSFLRKFSRGLVEMIRIIFPQCVVFCSSILFIAYAHDLITEQSIIRILLKLPFYFLVFFGIPSFLVLFILKWIIAGKYKKDEHPIWSPKVWLSEAVTNLNEALANQYFLNFLRGTPYLPFFFNLLGTKIGKKVYMDTTDITEYDLVQVGDYSELNYNCGLQTHLFEDRIMKMDFVKVGANVTIGANTIILYNTSVKDNVNIAPLSLVMKGEELEGNTAWKGIPVSPK